MKNEELKALLSESNNLEFVQLTLDELITIDLQIEDIKGVAKVGDQIVIEYGETEFPLKSLQLLDMLERIDDEKAEVGVMVEEEGVKVFKGIEEVIYLGGLDAGETIIKIQK